MRRWGPLLAALATVVLLGFLVGARSLSLHEIWQALFATEPANADRIALLSIRLPRILAGLVCGAALGAAGMVMQALTRNPLADPGILGINAGAAFAVTLGSLLLQRADSGFLAVLAFPGAAFAAFAVFALGGGFRGEAGPVRLTLAGVALTALLLSLVSAIILTRGETLEVVRFWVVGSLAEARARPMMAMSLAAVGGFVMAIVLAPRLEALALGNALARGLGLRPGIVQAGALLAVTLLTGASVALAGPIAFLGLMAPPLARHIAGARLRDGLIASALIGATVLLLADTLGRVLLAPEEIRAGVMTALVGGPAFVLIARRLNPGASS